MLQPLDTSLGTPVCRNHCENSKFQRFSLFCLQLSNFEKWLLQIFRYYRKLNHGQRTTFRKGPSHFPQKIYVRGEVYSKMIQLVRIESGCKQQGCDFPDSRQHLCFYHMGLEAQCMNRREEIKSQISRRISVNSALLGFLRLPDRSLPRHRMVPCYLNIFNSFSCPTVSHLL